MNIEELKKRFKSVKENSRLELIAGRYQIYLKNGDYFEGYCPFQTDCLTNKFRIDPIKQFFWCPDCENCGDVISFLNLVENLTPYEALEKLEREHGRKKQDNSFRDANTTQDLSPLEV